MLSDVFLLSGALFIFVASLGIVRLPDLFMRMHASAKSGTLGVSLILVADALYFSSWVMSLKVCLAILFMLLSAPVGFHLIGRSSYRHGLKLAEGTKQAEKSREYESSL